MNTFVNERLEPGITKTANAAATSKLTLPCDMSLAMTQCLMELVQKELGGESLPPSPSKNENTVNKPNMKQNNGRHAAYAHNPTHHKVSAR